MMKRQRSRKASNQRKGAAAVELAVTFPILMLVLFALFELTRANMMIHTAEAAAYECARLCIVPGANADDGRTAARQVLQTSGVGTSTIQITPADLTADTETVSVTVSVRFGDNSIFTPSFLSGAPFVKTCELEREKL